MMVRFRHSIPVSTTFPNTQQSNATVLMLLFFYEHMLIHLWQLGNPTHYVSANTRSNLQPMSRYREAGVHSSRRTDRRNGSAACRIPVDLAVIRRRRKYRHSYTNQNECSVDEFRESFNVAVSYSRHTLSEQWRWLFLVAVHSCEYLFLMADCFVSPSVRQRKTTATTARMNKRRNPSKYDEHSSTTSNSENYRRM